MQTVKSQPQKVKNVQLFSECELAQRIMTRLYSNDQAFAKGGVGRIQRLKYLFEKCINAAVSLANLCKSSTSQSEFGVWGQGMFCIF